MLNDIVNALNKIEPEKAYELLSQWYPVTAILKNSIMDLIEGDITTGQKTEEEILEKINEIKNNVSHM